MARILIIGGGTRGLALTRGLCEDGHAVRVTTRTDARRAAIEAAGGECFVGTPDRLATLRPALEGVTIACWLLGRATGDEEQIRALHGSRLEFFLTQIIDSTVRGFVYEACRGALEESILTAGLDAVLAITSRNSIPLAFIEEDPTDEQGWLTAAQAAIASLLA
ncbi:MAG TPA: hypothetical protein VID48_09105 [Solirubrobacteraceae bacterium]